MTTLTAAQKRVLVGMLKGEASKNGHGWTSRGMRLAYYYVADGAEGIRSTLPKVIQKLVEFGLVQADISLSDTRDTTWRLTEKGRTAATALQYGGRKVRRY